MVLKGLKYFVELVAPESLDFVVPSGEVQSCDRRFGLRVENIYEFEKETVGLFEVRELSEEYFLPCKTVLITL